MTWGIYIDHNVPAAVVIDLRRRGLDCLTAEEDLAARFDDEVVMLRAASFDRVLLTMDRDFLRITANWIATNRRFKAVIYGHQLKVSIRQIVEGTELIVVLTDSEDLSSEVFYLPI